MEPKFTLKDKLEYAKAIDFKPLIEHAKKYLPMPAEFIFVGARECNYYAIVDWHSDDICSEGQIGVFAKALQKCRIEPFNGSVVAGKTDEGEEFLYYWCSVDLKYKHKDGGKNGMELFTATYRDGEWKFRERN